MPSSLIFVALAAAWLVVLVPMFSRRRQEVAKTADSALAARVVRRGSGTPSAARAGARKTPRTMRVEEAVAMPEAERDDVDAGVDVDDLDHDAEHEDGQWRRVHSDDARAGRRYRPGRGGFDPEAAELAARAKYVHRQRLVLAMLLGAVVTAIVAVVAWTPAWWIHGAIDVGLVGYLTYLRRQVRIEEEVRHRRLARLNGGRADERGDLDGEWEDRELEDEAFAEEELVRDRFSRDEFVEEDFAEFDDESAGGSRRDRRPQGYPHPTRAEVVELDDEDPMFDELDERTWAPYRKASGE
ncbi:hypothetical protein GIY23_02995 [Allosaccharopolyspora coralli]|uniref:Transmembrane protein n=1 Tax=Allosaccharopolyspora coralli TaxID=2665642 RepID=A0A5Q3QAL8_9PSEU|nr:gephyrin-like molybdotransferase receptor GlpR [Allosaccharopolyspora coralli]QGK68659.1 hypothetical protein GIY23_02995 [Allosaccharopolyspora coralli]